MPRHGDQIGKHRVSHRCRHFRIGQRIKADINHALFTDHLLPVKDRTGIGHIGVVRRDQLCRLTGSQFLQQRQKRCHNFIVILLVITYRRTQAIEHWIVYFLPFITIQHLFNRHHSQRTTFHMPGNIALIQNLRQILHLLPQRRSVLHHPGFRIGLKQIADIVHVTLDKAKVWTLPQRDQRPGNNIDEAPGKLFKCGAVAFATELTGNTRSHFRNTTKAPDRVVTGADIRPAQMENMEFTSTACAV